MKKQFIILLFLFGMFATKVQAQGGTTHAADKNTNSTTTFTSPVTVYPNPVVDELEIKVDDAYKDDEKTILIYDILGRVLVRQTFQTSTSKVYVTNLPPGMYFMKVEFPHDLSVITRVVKTTPPGTN